MKIPEKRTKTEKEDKIATRKGPGIDIELIPLLHIVQSPGITVSELGKRLGITDRHASKLSILLHKKGWIKKLRAGKRIQLFPDPASTVAMGVAELDAANRRSGAGDLTRLFSPATNLRLIALLSGGPRTVLEITTTLGCSRPTFYRMVRDLGTGAEGLVLCQGNKEKVYSINASHRLFGPTLELARELVGEIRFVPGPPDIRRLHLTSLKNRVLLYLSFYTPLQESFVVPTSITQDGLAQALWSTQPIISKELRHLISHDLVREERQHVRREKRIHKTYHLTPEGMGYLEGVKQTLTEAPLPVVDLNGVATRKRMDEISAALGQRIRSVEVLNYLATEEVLNLNQFKKFLGSKRDSEFISILHRLPNLKYFFGREHERKEFRAWLDSKDRRVFLIRGIAGMGKTTFLTKVIHENRQRWNIFFYSIKEWSTLRNIITNIVMFLQRLKRTSFAAILENKGDFSVEESILILREQFKGQRTLMIFDDVQKSDPRVTQFFMALIKSDIIDDVKLTLAGRELGELDGLRRSRSARTSLLELSGLERKPSERLLSVRGIARSRFDAIYDVTGGHPLALELVENRTGLVGKNLKLFIQEEIVPRLTPVELQIMGFISVFRYPFTAEALIMGQEGWYFAQERKALSIPFIKDIGMPPLRKGKRMSRGHVQRLVDRSFLIQDGDAYYLHDIFRDFFYKRMDEQTRRKYHMLAADYYASMDNDPAKIEAIYHLMSGGDLTQAMAQMENWGDSLLKRGFSEDLWEIMRDVDLARVDAGIAPSFHYYLGQILYVQGAWQKALEQFQVSLKACEGQGKGELMTRAKIMVARIHSLQTESRVALKEYMEVIRLARKYGQYILESDAVKQVGASYYFLGDIKKLRRYHKTALGIAKRTGNKECLANANFLATFIAKLEGDYKKCEALYKEALEIYGDMGNRSQALMMMNNLGDLYYTQERWQDALAIFDQIVEGATAIGDMQLKAFGLANSGDSLVLMGKLDEAQTRISEALQLFNYLGEVRLIMGTYAIMGTLYKAKKDFAKAREYFEKAIEGQKRLEILQNLSVILWDYADMEEQAGNKQKAISLYKQALEYAKKMNEKKQIDKITKKLKTM